MAVTTAIFCHDTLANSGIGIRGYRHLKHDVIFLTITSALLAAILSSYMHPAFAATDSISLSPTSGPIGTIVSVSGSGFHSKDTIAIMFGGAGVTTAGNCTVKGNSFSECTFVVPPSPVGSQAVQVTDTHRSSALTAFTVIAPNAPVITPAPTTLTNDAIITIEGTKDANTKIKIFDTNGVTVVADTGITTVGTSWSLNTSALSDGVHILTARAYDSFGNPSSPSGSASVQVDTVAPTISGAATTSPNSNDWYNSDVTVHFTASDSGSGIDTVTPDIILTTEASDQSVIGTATDLAGNTASTTVSDINIDKTAPTITGSRTPAPNANGWNKVDVTVYFNASDVGGSGIATVSPDTIVTTEGTDQSITGTATDLAGNTASATVSGINIDKTVPTATLSLPLNHADIIGSSTSVTGTSSDYGSRINSVQVRIDSGRYYTATGTTSWTYTATGLTDGSHTITAKAIDKAGNAKATTISIQVSIPPSSPPSITIDSVSDTTPKWGIDTVTITGSVTDQFVGHDKVTVNWDDGHYNSGISIDSDGSWTASHVYAANAIDSRSITADVIRTMPDDSTSVVDSTDSPTVIVVQKHNTAITFTTSDVSSTSIKWGKTVDVTNVYLEDADTHTPLARTIRFNGSAVIGTTLGTTDSTGHLTSDVTITTRNAAGIGKTLAASFVAAPTGGYLSSSTTISIDLIKHDTAITTIVLDVPSVTRDATFHVTATVLVDLDNENSQLAGKTIKYTGTAVIGIPSAPTGTTSSDTDGLVSDVAITARHTAGTAKTVIATFNGGELYTPSSATTTIDII